MSKLTNNELNRLFAAVHDQVASLEEVSTLDDWLRDNPEGQRRYIEFIDTMQEIENQVGSYSTDSALNDPLQAEPSDVVAVPSRLAWSALLVVAASLMMVVGVVFWRADVTQSESRASSSSTEILGIVTASTNGKAYFDGKDLQAGSALKAGLVKLEEGTMKFRLESGVELSMVAPAEVDVHDPHQVELLSGALTADVPDDVIGFTVKVPGLNVVDLGTTFGVNIPKDGKPQVHVFDGVVDAETEDNRQKQRLTNDQTIRFDGKSIVATTFDQAMFVQPGSRGSPSPVTSGDVRFLETPLASVAVGQFEHDLILCFREQEHSIQVNQDVPVSFDEPGRYHVYPRWQNTGAIPSGTSVDSYFVHLDAVGTEKTPRQGSITFDRPILGVVFSRSLLLQQNEIFGDPRTVYESAKPNAKYDATLENESVTLSADRRTIRFRWFIRTLSDQVRVLVEARDENQ